MKQNKHFGILFLYCLVFSVGNVSHCWCVSERVLSYRKFNWGESGKGARISRCKRGPFIFFFFLMIKSVGKVMRCLNASERKLVHQLGTVINMSSWLNFSMNSKLGNCKLVYMTFVSLSGQNSRNLLLSVDRIYGCLRSHSLFSIVFRPLWRPDNVHEYKKNR